MDQTEIKIVSYQIEMLNVGDADAFVIYYNTNDDKKHLVLIDAGRYADGEKVLNHLNAFYSGLSVELSIVTHPDDDHYGGFVYLLEQIKDNNPSHVNIKRFWINDPKKHISLDDVKEDIQRKTLEKRLNDIYYANGTNLFTLLDGMKIPHTEHFAWIDRKEIPFILRPIIIEKCGASFQLGFTILSPTRAYFTEQCKGFRYGNVHRVEATDENGDIEDGADFKETDTCLSKVMDDANDDCSYHNRSSYVILFEPGDGNKFLFAGDASIDTFEKMQTPHKSACKNVTWLKVPHHGSKHNLNSAWIMHFNPKVAYISTLKRGQYLNQCVINALKKRGCKVISTHNNKEFVFIVHNNILDRELGIVNES